MNGMFTAKNMRYYDTIRTNSVPKSKDSLGF